LLSFGALWRMFFSRGGVDVEGEREHMFSIYCGIGMRGGQGCLDCHPHPYGLAAEPCLKRPKSPV